MPDSLLIVILSLCLNIKKLTVGTTCHITDQIFDQIFVSNKMQWLEEVEIRNSEYLSMKTISNLLLYCDNLISILDPSCWNNVSGEEILELEEHMRMNNINMTLSEEQSDTR